MYENITSEQKTLEYIIFKKIREREETVCYIEEK